MSGPLIYLVAGEASGDALGAGLMRSLKAANPEIRFAGVGGEGMIREGLESLFPMNELSLMGFLEVVPHIPALLRRVVQVRNHVTILQPDIVITIDSPGFNFRLAKELLGNTQTMRLKRVHYVAPSVWAYKPERARKTAILFDHLLALLPFEPPYFEREGLATTFVGHPALWEMQQADGTAFRARHGLDPATPVLLMLPGSRMGEVKRLLPIFLEAAKALPSHVLAILAAPQVKDYILAKTGGNALVCDVGEKYDAFAAASLALSKSGTITLELAVAGVPMVVAHRVSPLSAWLLRRMIRIEYVSLVNIAVHKAIVPELLQEYCTPRAIGKQLTRLTKTEESGRQRIECEKALASLRGGAVENPYDAAAKAVLGCLAKTM